MTSIALWILVSVAGTNRPATVIERFHTEQQCHAARAQLDQAQPNYRTGACLRVEAAR